MNRSRGIILQIGPAGTVEHETFSCVHCNRVRVVPHRAKPEDVGGFCRQCDGMLCLGCAKTGRCTPLEKRVEAIERRDANARAMGIGR